ncbi:PEP-CTERM sorting domain-containing protein [Paludibacterium paludis]|nr:PEP-CTERM sorting domain-containing protein [Paludibacterium paludis]
MKRVRIATVLMLFLGASAVGVAATMKMLKKQSAPVESSGGADIGDAGGAGSLFADHQRLANWTPGGDLYVPRLGAPSLRGPEDVARAIPAPPPVARDDNFLPFRYPDALPGDTSTVSFAGGFATRDVVPSGTRFSGIAPTVPNSGGSVGSLLPKPPIPEPETWALMGLGLSALLLKRRKRRSV